jgi:hypothetical protein
MYVIRKEEREIIERIKDSSNKDGKKFEKKYVQLTILLIYFQ